MDRLGRTRVWLADQFTPSVAVITSQEADSLCLAANGLSVVNLLRPFGVLNQLNGTIGGASGGLVASHVACPLYTQQGWLSLGAAAQSYLPVLQFR